MKSHFRVTLGVAVVGVFGLFADIAAVTPVVQDAAKDGKPNWWTKRHEEKLAIAKSGGAPVVFIGDSITHFWETRGKLQWKKYFADGPFRALNLGFSADRTEHVLWRLDHGELDGFSAKAVVLMIGTNNTGHKPVTVETPIDTVLGIRAVLDKIRAKQPAAKIVLCPIFPRGATAADANRKRNAVVNHEIMRFADNQTVFWCDSNAQFLTPSGDLPGEIFPDFLHPADYGYEVWAAAVWPYLDAAVNGKTMPLGRYAPAADASFNASRPGPCRPTSLIGRFREHWWRDAEMWFERVRQHRRDAAEGNGEFDLVFIGDSITRAWEDKGANVLADLRRTYSVLTLGIGGDRVQHVTWRVQNGELDGFKARLVMMMIGTNNNYGDAPEETAAGIRLAIDAIRAKQPAAKVLLVGVFPRGERPDDPKRINNAKVNAIIRNYADGKDVFWLDVGDRLMQPDGTISVDLMPDFLHPKEEGYRRWIDAALPFFKAACGK